MKNLEGLFIYFKQQGWHWTFFTQYLIFFGVLTNN